MIDPVIPALIACGFAVLFSAAALHKLGDFSGFVEIVRAYQIVPGALVRLCSALVVMTELAIVLLWLWPPGHLVAALATAILLSIYGFAILLNLVRGRTYIDCGCSFRGGLEQLLSPSLLYRNALLIAAACLTVTPVQARVMAVADYLTIALSLLALALLYGAAGQLLGNEAAIGSWRRKR